MLVSSYTTVKFQGIDPWVQVSQLEGHKPSSIHCSSCLVKHIKPSQKSDFSNNNNHFILAQKLEEWPRSVSIYAVTVRLWLESPQRIPCSCLMPGLERLKPLGGERARALRSITSCQLSMCALPWKRKETIFKLGVNLINTMDVVWTSVCTLQVYWACSF